MFLGRLWQDLSKHDAGLESGEWQFHLQADLCRQLKCWAETFQEAGASLENVSYCQLVVANVSIC